MCTISREKVYDAKILVLYVVVDVAVAVDAAAIATGAAADDDAYAATHFSLS